MRTTRGGTGLAAVVLLLLTGCGGDPPPPDRTAAPPPTFDPPLAFGEEILLGGGYRVDAFHVDQSGAGTLFTYQQDTAAIRTWDLVTGAEQGSATIDLEGGRPQPGPDGPPYAFAPVDDRMSLVIAYEHREPGVGTQPEQEVLRVRAYHTDDASPAWTTDLRVPNVDNARILAANAEHTVVVTGARDPATERPGRDEASVAAVSTVLDTATGQVRQVWDPFVAYALDRDVVAGLLPDPDRLDDPVRPAHRLTGRHVVTGDIVWEYEDVQLTGTDYFGRDLGGGVFLQPARSRGTDSEASATLSTNLVLEVGTGDVLVEVDHDGAAVTCRYDGEQLMACAHDQQDRAQPFLAAYDLHGRTMLWDLDGVGAGRELPDTVTAVRRGVIYMEFSQSRSRAPVALDARTGNDVAVDLPVAPVRVGPGYGLAQDELGHLSIYPATA